MSNARNKTFPVAITGLGVITPIGNTVEKYHGALVSGTHGFVHIQVFPTEKHRTRVAAEIRALPAPDFKRIGPKTLSRCDILALNAARAGLKNAGLINAASGNVKNPHRVGIVTGTAAGAILGTEEFFRRRVSGHQVENSLPMVSSFCLSAIATHIALEFGIKGPRLTIATVCSSSGLALAAAKEILATDEADAVLVIGAETLSQVSHAGFNSLRSIAPYQCRPFDLNRKGIILGEGAGAMVLENMDYAKNRGAHIQALLAGYGLTTDTHHFTAPQPEGTAIAETILKAMGDADVGPEKIDYINAHGTGTKLNDMAETRGIKAALGASAKKIVVSATKSMIGHQMGAAGILEGIATVMAMNTGVIHPTANLETSDPECDLDHAPEGPRKQPVDYALSNSFAFGGSDISLMFTKASETFPAPPSQKNEPDRTPAITGIGVVSPLGIGKESFLAGIHKGMPAMTGLKSFGEEWTGFSGGLLNMDNVNSRIPAVVRRRMNRQASFLFSAFDEAIQDTGIPSVPGTGAAIVYGTAFGCSENVQRFYSQLLEDGPKFVSPMEFNMSVTNAPPSLIAHHFGLKGPVWVFVGDEASWDLSLHWGSNLIRSGKADQVAVCAAETISASVLAIHHELGLLESGRHKGICVGEGAVCMTLEPLASTENRGSRIYGTITGKETFQDATCGPQDFLSDTEGLLQMAGRCMKNNMDKHNGILCISPENGDPRLDPVTDTLFEALGKDIQKLPIRSLAGESGMAGGQGLAAALLDRNDACISHILSLTCARGGVNTGTLIEKICSDSGK